MSKCIYCHGRKGKRECPALGGMICTQCCGEHRIISISCPTDCIYLDANSEYQQKRTGERYAQARREVYKDLHAQYGEKAAGVFNLIEVVTFGYFHAQRHAQDSEVTAGLQALRRSLSPVHIPSGPLPPFADQLKKEYEAFTKQEASQVVEDQHTVIAVLDRALQLVADFSGSTLRSSRFLTGLVGFIRTSHPQIAEELERRAGSSGRIILPSGMQHEGRETPIHSHSHLT